LGHGLLLNQKAISYFRLLIPSLLKGLYGETAI